MKMLTSVAAVSLALSCVTNAFAQNQPSRLSDEDRQLIVQEVIQYFHENPKELAETVLNWKNSAQTQADTSTLQPPMSGNPSGDVTIFEFPDYGCKDCNSLSQLLDEFAAEDSGVAIVHHDLPKSGRAAAQAAMEVIALYNRGLDWKGYRNRLIQMSVEPESRLKALEDINVKPITLDTVSAINTIRKNNEIAKLSGLQNQPAIVIAVGDKVQALSGEITKEQITTAIKRLRTP